MRRVTPTITREKAMTKIHAIFENGVFRPTEAVELPEHTEVEFEPQIVAPTIDAGPALDAVYEVMSRRHESGFSDTAERHNEHQP
jgi:predicted DNA-binding antitoxin AbrB/MazE fold protein